MNKPRFLYSRFWKDIYYDQISTRFNPRNKWVNKAIPRQFRDIDGIFEEVLYAGIISFVDEQKCFEIVEWSYNEHYQKIADKIKEIYQWAKTGRTEKFKELEAAYPEIPKGIDVLNDWINSDKYGTYEEKYGKMDKIDKFIEDKDTEYLTWIVQYRKYLWT